VPFSLIFILYTFKDLFPLYILRALSSTAAATYSSLTLVFLPRFLEAAHTVRRLSDDLLALNSLPYDLRLLRAIAPAERDGSLHLFANHIVNTIFCLFVLSITLFPMAYTFL
jgi:hypothetical protein